MRNVRERDCHECPGLAGVDIRDRDPRGPGRAVAYFSEELVSGQIWIAGNIDAKARDSWVPGGMHLTGRTVGVQPGAVEWQGSLVGWRDGGGKNSVFDEAGAVKGRRIRVKRTESKHVRRRDIRHWTGA